MKTLHWHLALVLFGAAIVAPACNSSSPAARGDGGGNPGVGGGGSSGTAGSGGMTGGGGGGSNGDATGAGGADGNVYDGPFLGVDGTGKIPIGSTQCSDGVDNDGDGLVDYADKECVGPLDNDEGSFATGIPGDNIDACKQDCFFDGNSGMGDDGCDWQLKCDPKNVGATAENSCPYSESYVTQHEMECSTGASQSQKCIDNCRPLVPNGCDCFGCCMIPGAPTAIRLASTCTASDFNDPTKCPPCTQVTQCANPCERCELCVGKDTLPADCGGGTGGSGGNGGGTGGADGSVPPPPTPDCGAYMACMRNTQGGIDATTACPVNFGCIQGCCFPVNIVQ